MQASAPPQSWPSGGLLHLGRGQTPAFTASLAGACRGKVVCIRLMRLLLGRERILDTWQGMQVCQPIRRVHRCQHARGLAMRGRPEAAECRGTARRRAMQCAHLQRLWPPRVAAAAHVACVGRWQGTGRQAVGDRAFEPRPAGHPRARGALAHAPRPAPLPRRGGRGPSPACGAPRARRARTRGGEEGVLAGGAP